MIGGGEDLPSPGVHRGSIKHPGRPTKLRVLHTGGSHGAGSLWNLNKPAGSGSYARTERGGLEARAG